MIVSIHQPHYRPWLRYLDKLARSDAFIILDDVEFTKNGWQNRNAIKSAQGRLLLTAPVRHKAHQKIPEVELDGGKRRKKHWRSLRQDYAAAPFFETYAAELGRFYERDWDRLVDLNVAMLEWHVRALGLETRLFRSSELEVTSSSSQRLVELVGKVGGTTSKTTSFTLDLERGDIIVESMAETKALYTAEDLEKLGGDYELDRGRLVPLSPGNFYHGRVCTTIGYLFEVYCRETDLGVAVVNDSGFHLEWSPDTVRGPDVAFVRWDRLKQLDFDEIPTRGFCPGAPSIAVEVRSPSNSVGELLRKTGQYLDAGCPLVWVVFPERRQVVVYRQDGSTEVLTSEARLSGEEVAPGLSWLVSELFPPTRAPG